MSGRWKDHPLRKADSFVRERFLHYIIPTADTRHADPSVARRVLEFFAAKNSGSPDRFLDRFSRSEMTYSDATLGRRTNGWEKFGETIRRIMPNWQGGLSYPLRIVGGSSSAIVLLTDTPELFGEEIRALAAVDFDDAGRVIRWVDYWDSSGFSREAIARMSTSDSEWPEDFGLATREPEQSIVEVCNDLHDAIVGGLDCGDLFAFDATWEDMALGVRLEGRRTIGSMLARMGRLMPYGQGTEIRHVVGGGQGGGFEWAGSSSAGPRAGITAIELDAHRRVSRVTVTYDSMRLDASRHRDLAVTALSARGYGQDQVVCG